MSATKPLTDVQRGLLVALEGCAPAAFDVWAEADQVARRYNAENGYTYLEHPDKHLGAQSVGIRLSGLAKHALCERRLAPGGFMFEYKARG